MCIDWGNSAEDTQDHTRQAKWFPDDRELNQLPTLFGILPLSVTELIKYSALLQAQKVQCQHHKDGLSIKI
jgi:hypothetical protein